MRTAIDIGGGLIKLVEGQAKGDGVAVRRAVTIPTPADSARDGRILDAEAVAAAIRQGLEAAGIRLGALTFTLGSTQLLHRELKAPRMAPRKLAPVVGNEMMQHLTGGEDFAVDYLLTGEPAAEDPRLQIIAASAVPKEMVRDFLTLTRLLRARPDTLQMHPSALGKLFAHGSVNGTLTEGRGFIVCDIGLHLLHIYLYASHRLLFTRCIKAPCEAFFASVQRMLGYESGQQVLESFSVLPERLIKNLNAASAASGLLSFLSEELSRMLQFSLSRGLPSPVSRIYLTGGVSSLGGLCENLSSSSGVAVERVERFLGVTGIDPGELALYANAVGALSNWPSR